ncbi:MAG: hypothetical protein AAB932_06620 [Patescibacteria group bacterium]
MSVGNSLDLLYIVLALCILWFTIFLCWLLYQAARVLRNANVIIENLMRKLELISDAVEFIREKVESVSDHMGIITRFAGDLVEKFVVGKISTSLEERSKKKKAPKVEKKQEEIL